MKKFIRTLALVLTFTVLTASFSVASAFALKIEDYYLDSNAFFGDADGDYKITVKDATAVQKHLAKLVELERTSKLLSDVDGNGKLTISDATDIQKYLANIINYFETDPTECVESDGEKIRVELTTEDPVKITVRIPRAGYYRFISRRISGGTCCFDIYDGTEFIEYVYGDGSVVDEYIYLSAGRYTVYLEPSWEYEKDVAEFSVTSANDKIPFRFADAKELKPGERIEITAGSDTPVYKLNPASLENSAEGLMLYTQGEDPKVKFEVYDENLLSYYKVSDDGVNTESDLITSVCYVAVTQAEGGTDFTLCCDGYLDYNDLRSKGIYLDTPDVIELEEYFAPEYPDGGVYRAFVNYKFTPSESGYYKLTFNTQDSVEIFGDSPYYLENPEELKTYRVLIEEESQYLVQYLNAGTTYYFVYRIYDWENKSDVECKITKSTEQEYIDWLSKVNESDVFEEPEHTVINLGDREFVTIGCDDDYYSEDKTYKFTAEEDMTVVAYSEGSYNANVYAYGTDGMGHTSGYSSEDFTVVIDLKAGESCYFDISSNDCFEFDDSFFFSVVDIMDYQPIS